LPPKPPLAPLFEKAKENPNVLVAWYLMASYAYYELDTPFLNDGQFDEMAQTLLKHFDSLTHRHLYMITKDELEAGTMLRRDFPQIAMDATHRLLRMYSY
jgi:NAD-dependent DNA ligase